MVLRIFNYGLYSDAFSVLHRDVSRAARNPAAWYVVGAPWRLSHFLHRSSWIEAEMVDLIGFKCFRGAD